MWPPDASSARNGGSKRIRLEVEGGDVAVQVVDGTSGSRRRERQRLRGGEADEERADQPRPLGDGHRVDVVQGDTGVGEGALDRGHDQLQMLGATATSGTTPPYGACSAACEG